MSEDKPDPIREMYDRQKWLEENGHEVQVIKSERDRLAPMALSLLQAGLCVSMHYESGDEMAYLLAWRTRF